MLNRAIGALCAAILGALALTLMAAPSYWPSPAFLAQESHKPQPKTNGLSEKSYGKQRRAEFLVCKFDIFDAQKDQDDASLKQTEQFCNATPDWWTIGIGIVTALILLLQTAVFGRQAFRLRQSVDYMHSQGNDMRESIAQAARSADAMEKVSGSLKINADKIVESVGINQKIAARQQQFGEMQLRAYIGVTIGPATYQDTNNRFAAAPIFFNTGHTPAYQFRYRVMAEILPVPLPMDYKFKLPPRTKASILVPPGQRPEAYTIVKDRIDDTAVEDAKRGRGQSLYVWGLATYNDAFGKTRRATFLQQIYWIGEPGKETVRGLYLDRHSQSN
jgi:hypothetical protein